MDTMARQVCLNAGGDTFLDTEDVEAIFGTLRNYSEPDELGHVYREVTKFPRHKRTGQTVGRYVLEFIFFVIRREHG